MTIKFKNRVDFFCVLFITITLFFPLFDSSLYFGFLLITSVLFVLVALLFYERSQITVGSEYLIFLTFLFLFWLFTLFFYVYVSIFNNLKTSFADTLEFIKLPYYAAVSFFFYFSLSQRPKITKDLFFIFFFVVALLGIVSLFSDSVALFYTSSKLVRWGRLCAPFINPYTFAFCISFFVLWFYLEVTIGELSNGKRFYYFFLFSIALILLFLTQSRSSIFSVILVLFLSPIFLLIFFSRKKRREFKIRLWKASIFGIVASVVFYYAIYFLELTYTTTLVEQLTGQQEFTNDSVNVRIQQLSKLTGYLIDIPFSIIGGFGPAKNEFKLLESGYAYILFRHGLIGLLIYLTLFIFLFLFALKKATEMKSPFYLAISLYIFSFPLLLSSSMHIEHPKASFFFAIIIGALLAEYRERKSSQYFRK